MFLAKIIEPDYQNINDRLRFDNLDQRFSHYIIGIVKNMSMMCHIAKIMKQGDTFRMNVADRLCVGNRGR